jgi:hypothetical protein
MGIKVAAAAVAVILMFGYLLALLFKLKEIDLGIVIVIGLAMMLVDLWQSFRSKDG